MPIGVSLPKTVDLKIVETAPGFKSATITKVLKPATLETATIVQVPDFVNEGDVIRIDTETGGICRAPRASSVHRVPAFRVQGNSSARLRSSSRTAASLATARTAGPKAPPSPSAEREAIRR
jgi:hypothetical protein